MTTETQTDLNLEVIAQALANVVTTRVGRPFRPTDEPAEILGVYFAPPAAGQDAEAYAREVIAPVAAALVAALDPWTASAPLPHVSGAAGCVRLVAQGLALRVTASNQWDARTNPAPNKVELRVEVGVA